MPTKTIIVPTLSYGLVQVPVEVFGPVAVQPHIFEDGPAPRLSTRFYGIVHLGSGYLLTQDDWTLEQARGLALELSRLQGWERIPSHLPHQGWSGARKAVGEAFHSEVMRLLGKHRAMKRRNRRG